MIFLQACIVKIIQLNMDSQTQSQTSSKLRWEHYKNRLFKDDWRKIPTLRERKTYHPQNNSISVFRYTENDELHSYSFCYLSEQGSNNEYNKIKLNNDINY